MTKMLYTEKMSSVGCKVQNEIQVVFTIKKITWQGEGITSLTFSKNEGWRGHFYSEIHYLSCILKGYGII